MLARLGLLPAQPRCALLQARLKYLSWCPTKLQPLPCSAKVEEERMVALHARKFVTDILTASRCAGISCLKLRLYSLFHTWLSALFAARYEIVVTIWETSGFQPVSTALMEGGSSSPGGEPPCRLGQQGTHLNPPHREMPSLPAEHCLHSGVWQLSDACS